jgi:hypothetical protein
MPTDGGNPCNSTKSGANSKPSEFFDLIYERRPLQQGDVLFECPYVYPFFKDSKLDVYSEPWDIIILGHSCDIEWNKVDLLIVCPIWQLNEYFKSCANRLKTDKKYFSEFTNPQDFKDYIKGIFRDANNGRRIGFTMLKGAPAREGHTEPFLVDFTNAYSLPLDFVKHFADTDEQNNVRLRLKEEYTTYLIGRFAYFLSRALPPNAHFSYENQIEAVINESDMDAIINESDIDIILQDIWPHNPEN